MLRREENNKGLTLIELIVSIAILAIVVLPLLTAFLVSLRTNVKAKEKLRAVEIAQNFMEGMEATPVTEIMTQLTYPEDKFNLLANHSGVSAYEVLDDGTTYVKARTVEDIPDDVGNKEALVKSSIFRKGAGNYKFLGQSGSKYYFYVTNIPSDTKRYTAFVSIDGNTAITTLGSSTQKYNSFSVADMESIDTTYDAMNQEVISTASLFSDINLQEGLYMTESDAKYLTRTTTVTIDHPNASSNEAKVTISYSYQCKNYPIVDGENNPVMEGGLQKQANFVFPKDEFVNKSKYTTVIFDNAGIISTTDSYLKNVYLFYQPWYVSTQTDVLGMQDRIVINNVNNYACTVKIIKQKWVEDSVLGSLEQTYHVRVELKEPGSMGRAQVKFETNLGKNLSEDPTYPDSATKNQAVYVYNGGIVNSSKIYNAENPSLGGTKETSRLWVTTGFGISDARDRLYDVKVDIYPADMQLDDIYKHTQTPIVTLTGGLTD